MEKMRLATEAEKERLSEYIKYEDGQVDQPFLSSDTVKEINLKTAIILELLAKMDLI